jgi:hypothetical protein
MACPLALNPCWEGEESRGRRDFGRGGRSCAALLPPSAGRISAGRPYLSSSAVRRLPAWRTKGACCEEISGVEDEGARVVRRPKTRRTTAWGRKA